MIRLMTNDFAFGLGQIVVHRRYGYRAVVVARDTICQAPDDWYHSNASKPPQDKPWYHVLVHQGNEYDGIRYAAESNLELMATPQQIAHPLIDHFFIEWTGEKYIRNATEWPGW